MITYAVRNNVRVAVERSLGVTVLGLVTGEVPDDQSLVAGAGEEHVRARYQLVICSEGEEHYRNRV